MTRNDKKPKLKARRNLPHYEYGFCNNPATALYRHGNCTGQLNPAHAKVVSLFSGCGGMDLSFTGGFRIFGNLYKKLPFDILASYDFLQDAVDCHKLNLGEYAHCVDLTTFPANQIPSADILTGGFPFQDFSPSGPKTGFDGKRGKLYRILVDYMTVHQPKIVVGENVPHLARLNNGEYINTIFREFEQVGYHFDVWELYAPDFGVPQSRRRLFFIGVRNDLPGFPVKPMPTHHHKNRTISDALADLEGVDDETIANQSQFSVVSKATSGDGQGDHKNDPRKVAYCIRANARGQIQFHHHLDRRLTVRECARLQTFPDEFVFPYTTQRNLTLIGNAVPPVLGYRVAESIVSYLATVQEGGVQEISSPHCIPNDTISLTRTYVVQKDLFSC